MAFSGWRKAPAAKGHTMILTKICFNLLCLLRSDHDGLAAYSIHTA
jgi:hypothetical protein